MIKKLEKLATNIANHSKKITTEVTKNTNDITESLKDLTPSEKVKLYINLTKNSNINLNNIIKLKDETSNG